MAKFTQLLQISENSFSSSKSCAKQPDDGIATLLQQ